VRWPQMTERSLELPGTAAQHSEHRVQRDFVATLLERAFADLASCSQASGACLANSTPNCGSGLVIDC
jgi:hypothetical protein